MFFREISNVTKFSRFFFSEMLFPSDKVHGTFVTFFDVDPIIVVTINYS